MTGRTTPTSPDDSGNTPRSGPTSSLACRYRARAPRSRTPRTPASAERRTDRSWRRDGPRAYVTVLYPPSSGRVRLDAGSDLVAGTERERVGGVTRGAREPPVDDPTTAPNTGRHAAGPGRPAVASARVARRPARPHPAPARRRRRGRLTIPVASRVTARRGPAARGRRRRPQWDRSRRVWRR